jgi:hypothetical protein
MSERSERDLLEGAAVDGGAGTARRAEAGWENFFERMQVDVFE